MKRLSTKPFDDNQECLIPMATNNYRANILVCGGTGCTASGAHELVDNLQAEINRQGLAREIEVVPTGCRGFCAMGPVMMIYPEGIFYTQVQSADVPELVEETLLKGRVVKRLTYHEPKDQAALPFYKDIPFYGKQLRIALRNCGMIDPDSIEEYIARGGYEALGKAITSMSQEDVLREMKDSGLRGRGGAGFLAGLKWEFCYKAPGNVKYIICNADEGDPGAFMDRSIMEGDSHSVLEGMALAGYAIGATQGYVYIRAEYPLAVNRLRIAMQQARAAGLLGQNILNSGFSFDIDIKLGAGAFVCGEETSLINSIQGLRGEPRNKPPYPAQSGLWGKPTIVNNVETLANVPIIMQKGPEWYSSIGTEKSKGTKVFALAGKVNNVGLVEVPMGTTLRDIIYDIGGGIRGGGEFKAAQTGGPSGGCIPAQYLDIPIDYESLASIGSMMGSGGMIVMSDHDCMVNIAKFFLEFTVEESCGRCLPCRIGNKRMLEILTSITAGTAKMEDLDELDELAEVIKDTSLCGLGQTAPNPVLSTLRYFRKEYETHILDRRCPAGVCNNLFIFQIDPGKCIGCTACARGCPVGCIDGSVKQPHFINQSLCIKCGACRDKCKFDAVVIN